MTAISTREFRRQVSEHLTRGRRLTKWDIPADLHINTDEGEYEIRYHKGLKYPFVVIKPEYVNGFTIEHEVVYLHSHLAAEQWIKGMLGM